FSAVLGPFMGGVIDLSDAGALPPYDAGLGTTDGGTDAGVRDAGPPLEPPQFVSMPPTQTQCGVELDYAPTISPADAVVGAVRGAPPGLRLDGAKVVWTPQQSGTTSFTLIATNAGGVAEQRVTVEVADCALSFDTRGCQCSASPPLLLALAIASLIRRRLTR